jgi:hypothetical protein
MRSTFHRDPNLKEYKTSLGEVNCDNRFPERKSGSETGFNQFGSFAKSISDGRWRKTNKDLSLSFLAERMGIEKDPSEADGNTRK